MIALKKPKMIDMNEVIKRTGLDRVWIWRLRKAGKFPQGVQYNGPSSPNWFKESEVIAFIKRRTK